MRCVSKKNAIENFKKYGYVLYIEKFKINISV